MKKIITICVMALTITSAQAAITSVTNVVDAGAAPADLDLDVEENALPQVFAEQQNVLLAGNLAVDINSPGSYSFGSCSAPDEIPLGATVNSYIVHFDPCGTGILGEVSDCSITFDRPILGLIFQSGHDGDPDNLAASDSVVGASGTYWIDGTRGMDLCWLDQDPISLSGDRRTVEFDVYATAMDEFRIIEQGPATIEKTFDTDDADLGDHVTVTLDVYNPYDVNVVVKDELDPSLRYIPSTFAIDSCSVTPTVDGDLIQAEVESGTHQITFDVQVVEVQEANSLAENCAAVYFPEDLIFYDDANCATMTLHPYEGFTKVIENWTGSAEPNYVPIHTDVHWWLNITVENIAGDDLIDMNDIVVTDRLGGDLEVNDVNSISQGDVSIVDYTKGGKKKGGKTEKLFVTWDIGDVNDTNSVELVLEISTDVNPGQKKKSTPENEYTETGTHYLNSGATLKFIDPETGFQLSAHTPPIIVEAYEP